jgi:serine/threonine protein kinase/tetratricopeptide (TPR) repeat protein
MPTTTGEMPPDDPDKSPEELWFLRYRALKRAGKVTDFETFLSDEVPKELHDKVRKKKEDWDDLVALIGREPDDVDLAVVLDEWADPGLTQTFGDIGAGGGGDDGGDIDVLLGDLAFDREFRERYEIDRKIGQGGGGDILRVWDRRLRRILAMKVMRRPDKPAEEQDDDEQKKEKRKLLRFRAEALVTAQLDHPGILPVHDIGLDENGLVFFTMKYVRGRRNLARIFDMVARAQEDWTVNRAVGSILRVCEAVAYAHSKNVMHRDIKPANIMVGEYGETYLLDWGLARRLGEADASGAMQDFVEDLADDIQLETAGHLSPESGEGLGPGDVVQFADWLFTRDGNVMGTPPYMSPEQAWGHVDQVGERSDVYSLGALMYHLLSDRPPYCDKGERPFPLQVLVRVRAGGLTPVTELAPDAPPGLVEICEKAMTRDPAGRYTSASDMARALEDYLEDISEAREEARLQAQRANKINELLVQMLTSADPRSAQGEDVTVLQVLERFSQRIERGLIPTPLDEAALRRTMGNVFRELGKHQIARQHLTRAHELYDEILGFKHRETLAAATDLAVLMRIMAKDQDGLRESEHLLLQIRDVQAEGSEPLDTLRTLLVLSETVRRLRQGGLAEVRDLLVQVVEGRRRLLGDEHVETLTAMNRLAMVLSNIDQADPEAERLLRQAVDGLRRTRGDRFPETLSAMSDLATLLQQTDRLEEAEDLQRRSLDGQRVVLGEFHPETVMSLANLGWLLTRSGQLHESEAILRRVVELQRHALGEEAPDLLVYRNNLAKTLRLLGRPREALEMFDEVLTIASRLKPRQWDDGDEEAGDERRGEKPSWHAARIRHNLAGCLVDLGELPRAHVEYATALEQLRAALGPFHAVTKETFRALEALEDRMTAEGVPFTPIDRTPYEKGDSPDPGSSEPGGTGPDADSEGEGEAGV